MSELPGKVGALSHPEVKTVGESSRVASGHAGYRRNATSIRRWPGLPIKAMKRYREAVKPALPRQKGRGRKAS